MKRVKKLSTRIKDRMVHCYKCKGKGWYKKPEWPTLKLACSDCSDWKVALRGVLELEKTIRSLKKRIA